MYSKKYENILLMGDYPGPGTHDLGPWTQNLQDPHSRI